jgi:hypothetical protein
LLQGVVEEVDSEVAEEETFTEHMEVLSTKNPRVNTEVTLTYYIHDVNTADFPGMK